VVIDDSCFVGGGLDAAAIAAVSRLAWGAFGHARQWEGKGESMSIRRSLALLAVPAATLALTATPAMASAAAPAASSGTEIIVANTAFGPSLAVGSGPYKNYTLYFISSDHGTSFGCTTGTTTTLFGPIICTGPSNDKNAEWPAITTTGRPVAGPGVSQSLLGRVYRKGIGWQVTYAGHPLYLFDQAPAQVTGEGWFEPGIPPWHGIWWLISASGEPVPWAGTLTTTKIGSKTVLAEPFLTGAGWINFPVYTFSGDQSYSGAARCGDIPACARAWPPVLTSGSPGYQGVRASGIGEVGLPGGLRQVTWHGQPLYLFSNEQAGPLPNGGAAPLGNGNGVKAFGGTFSLVLNP
jgi:predicted lipoprotein with Yx(FWY)xxD motif